MAAHPRGSRSKAHVYTHIQMSVRMPRHTPMHTSVRMSAPICICMRVSIHDHARAHAHASVHRPVYMFVHMFIHMSIVVSVHIGRPWLRHGGAPREGAAARWGTEGWSRPLQHFYCLAGRISVNHGQHFGHCGEILSNCEVKTGKGA